MKVVQSDTTESSIDNSSQLQHTQDEGAQKEDENVTATAKKRNPLKKLGLQEDVDRQLLKALQNTPDEDEAFFMSITPSVRNMQEEDKLEFGINVLQLLKKR